MERKAGWIGWLILLFIVVGCGGQPVQVPILIDSDRDGLPDQLELQLGTDPLRWDTDGDGLSDYWEVYKYGTDPLRLDTGGDGIPDSDWDKRKVHGYTITAVVDLRPPFNIDHMNDFYQDARILEERDDGTTRVEVVLYPEAQALLQAREYQRIVGLYTQQTFTKNFSVAMQERLLRIVKGANSDYEGIVKIISYLERKFRYLDQQKNVGCVSSLPVQFQIYKDEQGQVVYNNLPESSKYNQEQVLDKLFFAEPMFFAKAHGSCSSKATLRGAMLRGAGIPEKTVFSIPLTYYYEDEEIELKLNSKYRVGYENISVNSAMVANHVYNEAYIGGQWVRVDDVIDPGVMVFGTKPYIKILEYNDSTDYNFSTYWNYETWRDQRPFQYVSIKEQFPKAN